MQVCLTVLGCSRPGGGKRWHFTSLIRARLASRRDSAPSLCRPPSRRQCQLPCGALGARSWFRARGTHLHFLRGLRRHTSPLQSETDRKPVFSQTVLYRTIHPRRGHTRWLSRRHWQASLLLCSWRCETRPHLEARVTLVPMSALGRMGRKGSQGTHPRFRSLGQREKGSQTLQPGGLRTTAGLAV